MPLTAPDGYVTIRAAAEMLGVHYNTIRNYIKQNTLEEYRLGTSRIIWVKTADVEALRVPTPSAR